MGKRPHFAERCRPIVNVMAVHLGCPMLQSQDLRPHVLSCLRAMGRASRYVSGYGLTRLPVRKPRLLRLHVDMSECGRALVVRIAFVRFERGKQSLCRHHASRLYGEPYSATVLGLEMASNLARQIEKSPRWRRSLVACLACSVSPQGRRRESRAQQKAKRYRVCLGRRASPTRSSASVAVRRRRARDVLGEIQRGVVVHDGEIASSTTFCDCHEISGEHIRAATVKERNPDVMK